MNDNSNPVSLMPKIYFLGPQFVALFLIIPWLSIAALSGMAFDTPDAAKLLLVWVIVGSIWVYPLICIACLVFAWLNYSKDRYGYAQLFSWCPLIYAVLMLNVFPPALRFFSHPHYSKSEIAAAKFAFDEKCKDAKEVIYSKPTEEVDGVLIVTSLPISYIHTSNFKYENEGPPLNFYGVINSGYMRFYEELADLSKNKDGATPPYKLYEFGNAAGKFTHVTRSKYAVKFLSELTEKEKALGFNGGSIEVIRIDSNLTVARTTFFANHLHNWFCGHVTDSGHFDTFSFLLRALDLKPIYETAYAKSTH